MNFYDIFFQLAINNWRNGYSVCTVHTDTHILATRLCIAVGYDQRRGNIVKNTTKSVHPSKDIEKKKRHKGCRLKKCHPIRILLARNCHVLYRNDRRYLAIKIFKWWFPRKIYIIAFAVIKQTIKWHVWRKCGLTEPTVCVLN